MGNVLVIDDQARTRDLLVRKISRAGYSMLVADNRNSALAIAASSEGVHCTIVHLNLSTDDLRDFVNDLKKTVLDLRIVLVSYGGEVADIAGVLGLPCSVSHLRSNWKKLFALLKDCEKCRP